MEEDPRIKRARKLKKKYNGLLGYFYKPDYIESGDILVDVANECTDIDLKEKYYIEAADTFILENREYGFFRAAEIYKILIDLEETKEIKNNITKYYILYSNMLKKSNNIFLAGSTYVKVGDIYRNKSYSTAKVYYHQAKELFKEYNSAPAHLKLINEKLIDLALDMQDYEDCLNILREIDSKYQKFFIELLLILLKRESEYELDDAEQNTILSDVINKEPNEVVQILQKYSENHLLPEYAKKIFLALTDKLDTEYDIC